MTIKMFFYRDKSGRGFTNTFTEKNLSGMLADQYDWNSGETVDEWLEKSPDIGDKWECAATEITRVEDHYSLSDLVLYPMDPGTNFDDIEVHPVIITGLDSNKKEVCEICDEGEHDFYSLYIHIPENGMQCIADISTKEQAYQLHDMLMLAGKLLIREI